MACYVTSVRHGGRDERLRILVLITGRGYAVLDVSDDSPDVREGDEVIGIPLSRGECVVRVEKREVTFRAFNQGIFSRSDAATLPYR